jgi:hypothetical protein
VRVGSVLGGREGMVYTVGESRKFGLVGLGNEGLRNAAVLGWRRDDDLRERGAIGDSGRGNGSGSTSGEFENSEAPNVVCVGVRAGLRSGIVGVGVRDIGSSVVTSFPMMSWYQS